jgi:hypothetical protein
VQRIYYSFIGILCLFITACATVPEGTFETSVSTTSEITSSVTEIDSILLKGTIEAAEALVYPHSEVNINYDVSNHAIHVTFFTPKTYKVNFGDYYQRWRHNQWTVYREFRKALEIPVKVVTVETNFEDGSAILKITHLAEHVEKYANSASDELWVRTGEFLMKESGSNEWVPIGM